MIIIDAAEVQRLLTWPSLVGALGDMFAGGCEAPARHHHPFDIPGENAGTLLLMPAWAPGRYLGVKIVTVVPDNGTRGLPAIAGTYLLSSAATGETLAILDGASLTAWRTAAASALASKLLSREDSEDLVIVGTGALSARLAAAHASVRPIRRIKVWGRSADKAADAVGRIRAEGLEAEAITDLEAAVRSADIVSCATLSRAPLVLGDWLKPGAHLDLVGAFNPGMRESDDAAILRSTPFRRHARRRAARGRRPRPADPRRADRARGDRRRPARALPRPAFRPDERGRDHPFQIRRRLARGSGRGRPGLRALHRRDELSRPRSAPVTPDAHG